MLFFKNKPWLFFKAVAWNIFSGTGSPWPEIPCSFGSALMGWLRFSKQHKEFWYPFTTLLLQYDKNSLRDRNLYSLKWNLKIKNKQNTNKQKNRFYYWANVFFSLISILPATQDSEKSMFCRHSGSKDSRVGQVTSDTVKQSFLLKYDCLFGPFCVIC